MAGMDFSKLLSQIDQVTTKKTYEDNSSEFWKPTKDKAGNATAVIRFLPNKVIDDFPFVRIWSHSFKNKSTNRWYIENSLSTLGEQDYIGEVNRELYNSKVDENIEIAKHQKRKLSYISNILVIKDTGNPENDGKVFKFKYGKKIFDKIVLAAKPDEELGESPVNAFDPVGGADFLLKQKVVSDFPNYDDSKFTNSKPLCGGNEKEIKAILDNCYDINLEVAADKFKTYDELKSKFLWVMGQETNNTSRARKSVADKEVDDELDELQKLAVEPKETVKKKSPPLPEMDDSDDDSDASSFESLIED